MNTYAPIRTASDPQPTVADSILRAIARMPIREQIALVQSVVEGEAWQIMGYEDGLRLDRSLASFVADLETEGAFYAADSDTLSPYREAAADRAYYQAVAS